MIGEQFLAVPLARLTTGEWSDLAPELIGTWVFLCARLFERRIRGANVPVSLQAVIENAKSFAPREWDRWAPGLTHRMVKKLEKHGLVKWQGPHLRLLAFPVRMLRAYKKAQQAGREGAKKRWSKKRPGDGAPNREANGVRIGAPIADRDQDGNQDVNTEGHHHHLLPGDPAGGGGGAPDGDGNRTQKQNAFVAWWDRYPKIDTKWFDAASDVWIQLDMTADEIRFLDAFTLKQDAQFKREGGRWVEKPQAFLSGRWKAELDRLRRVSRPSKRRQAPATVTANATAQGSADPGSQRAVHFMIELLADPDRSPADKEKAKASFIKSNPHLAHWIAPQSGTASRANTEPATYEDATPSPGDNPT